MLLSQGNHALGAQFLVASSEVPTMNSDATKDPEQKHTKAPTEALKKTKDWIIRSSLHLCGLQLAVVLLFGSFWCDSFSHFSFGCFLALGSGVSSGVLIILHLNDFVFEPIVRYAASRVNVYVPNLLSWTMCEEGTTLSLAFAE